MKSIGVQLGDTEFLDVRIWQSTSGVFFYVRWSEDETQHS